MSGQVINIGTAPNNGTGDPLRTAFAKAQNNFSEIYASLSFNDTTTDVTLANNLVVTANAQANILIANTKLNVGNASGFAFGTLAVEEIHGNQNTYVQTVIQNANTGLSATADFIVTSDTGNDSVNYLDLGLNSSVYSNAAYNIGGPGDAYLYNANGNITIGTAGANAIIFHTSGTTSTNEVARITPTGNVGIGNSNPQHSLSVNNTIFVNTSVTIGNSSVNASVNSTLYSGTANNATYLGGTIASSYQQTGAPLTSNVNSIIAGFSGTINATQFNTGNVTTGTGGFVGNSGQIFIGNSTGNSYLTSATLSVNGALVVNSSGFFVNTTYTPANLTVSNTSGNVIILPTSVAVSNSTANLTLTSSYIIINTNLNNGISIGNNTVNTYSNSTHFYSGNSTVYGYTNSTAEGFVSTSGNNISTPTSMTIQTNTTTNNISTALYDSLANSTANTVTAPGSVIMQTNTTVNAVLTTTSLILSNSTGNTTHSAFGITVASATTNAVVNTTVIALGNSTINNTINATAVFIGNNTTGTGAFIANTTGTPSVFIGNTTVNVNINTASLSFGSATTNAVVNTTTILIGNSINQVSANISAVLVGNSTATTTGTGGILLNNTAAAVIIVGNTTINTFINSSAAYIGASNNHTAAGSNGYTTLPNGLKLAYGSLLVNSIANTINVVSTVGVTPVSNILSISVASNATATFFAAYTVTPNTFVVVGNSATNALCYWQALVL